MMHRFAYLYALVDRFDLRALLNDLSLNGITLSNPANGRITVLTTNGDQVDFTLEMLIAAVSSRDPITFQLWMPDHADICCRIRYLGDNRLVEEYDFVGLQQHERGHVIKVLGERFSLKAQQEDHLFFVGDSEGYSIDVNWDELALVGRYEPKLCPNILGVPLQRLIDFDRCRANSYECTQIGKYLIIRNKPSQAPLRY